MSKKWMRRYRRQQKKLINQKCCDVVVFKFQKHIDVIVSKLNEIKKSLQSKLKKITKEKCWSEWEKNQVRIPPGIMDLVKFLEEKHSTMSD